MLLLCIFAYFLYTFYNVQSQLSAIEHEATATQRRIEEARQQNALLLQEKERLESRPHIEKIAREELGLVRPGETPIMTSGGKQGRP